MSQAFTQYIELDKDSWQFRDADSSDWMPCHPPLNLYSGLLQNKAIVQPYFGDHEKKLKVLSGKNWQFKHIFYVDSQVLNRKEIDLVCAGIDTYCDIYLNGHLLGSTDNAFRKYIIPVKKWISEQQNELLFSFRSAKNITDSAFSIQNPALPGGPRVFARKPQFHFGWDFGPEFILCGLSQLPRIVAWDGIRIDEAGLHTLEANADQASLRLQAVLFNPDTTVREVVISCRIADVDFNSNTLLLPGKSVYRNTIELKNPVLWWPRGSGSAHLYDCTLELRDTSQNILDKAHWKTGIRTIQLIAEPDSIGQSFYFKVNGEPVFCKGSNYIPSDILFHSDEKWKTLLQTAAESHFNMLRVWGGGTYEADAFYQTCDSLGIMVWQDFMFACAMYPDDSAFIENVSIEAEQQIQRLSKHACIALFCGNNENKEGWHRWGWQSELDNQTKQKWWNAYQNLFQKLLPDQVQLWAPGISYWDSSPLFGRGDSRFTTYGDAHDWGLWHDEMPFSNLESRIPRFMSEFGFQSLPSLATIQEFVPANELQLESASMLNHQKHPRGNKLIKEYIARDYPEPSGFEELVYLNQICQADGISQIIRAHRRSKPYCMGSLYWQFNDCWPGISWSGIDYLGKWKALQHHVKNAYAPVLFTSKVTENGIEIWGINDTRESQYFQLDLTIQDFYGNPVYFQSLEDTLLESSSRYIHFISINLDELNLRQTHYLQLKWSVGQDTQYVSHFFEKPKKINWPEPELHFEVKAEDSLNATYLLSSNTFVRALYIKETKEEAYMPNFFDLHPSVPVEVKRKKPPSVLTWPPETLSLSDIK